MGGSKKAGKIGKDVVAGCEDVSAVECPAVFPNQSDLVAVRENDKVETPSVSTAVTPEKSPDEGGHFYVVHSENFTHFKFETKALAEAFVTNSRILRGDIHSKYQVLNFYGDKEFNDFIIQLKRLENLEDKSAIPAEPER